MHSYLSSNTVDPVSLVYLLPKSHSEFCDAFFFKFHFPSWRFGEKARSPWLQMRAIGWLGKVRLLAPPALLTSSDKKHLTLSIWKAGVTLCVCFSGRCVRGWRKEQVEWGIEVSSRMCVSLADLKWQRKAIHHTWHEDDWIGHNRHRRCNCFLAPYALRVCVCMSTVGKIKC